MSEHIKNFIDNLANGNNSDAGENFKDALRAKIGDALEVQRKDVASNMFQQAFEADPISDDKPEVAEPGVFNQDGSVTNSSDVKADAVSAEAETSETDNK